MQKLGRAVFLTVLMNLSSCATTPSMKPLEGVAVSKVIDQIKKDLVKSSVADIQVGDGKVRSCGENKTPFVLIRDANQAPTVTLKLSTVKAIDITGDAGVAKVPVFSILFSADASYEYKRQETVEQDITFNIVRPVLKGGDPVVVVVPPESYSELGKAINEAELGILAADHEEHPCLQPSKLSVNVLVDVTRTTGVNGGIGFALLYSVTAKSSHSNELKNQIQIDLAYDKKTPAGFTAQ
jgi:hypothetical protein